MVVFIANGGHPLFDGAKRPICCSLKELPFRDTRGAKIWRPPTYGFEDERQGVIVLPTCLSIDVRQQGNTIREVETTERVRSGRNVVCKLHRVHVSNSYPESSQPQFTNLSVFCGCGNVAELTTEQKG